MALSRAIADLRQHRILPCLPLSEHLPFDLIAVMPDMETLVRVQVKYRSSNRYGVIQVEFKSNYYDTKRIYSKPIDFNEIDVYAVYISDIDQMCYFRVADLPLDASSITLRFEPPKNNQKKGVNLVGDFQNPLSISDKLTENIDLVPRSVVFDDEIAIAKFAAELQSQNIYPIYPRSMYAPLTF